MANNLLDVARNRVLTTTREIAQRTANAMDKPQSILNNSRSKSKLVLEVRPWKLHHEAAHEGYLVEVVKPKRA